MDNRKKVRRNINSNNKKGKISRGKDNHNKGKRDENNKFISYLRSYYTFYKENIKKKHIVMFVICICVFFIVFATYMSKITSTPDVATLIKNSENSIQNPSNIFTTIFKQNIPSVFIIIFAGIVPYIYLPVVGIGYAYNYALDIIKCFTTFSHVGNTIFMTIGTIINLVAISYAIATGMHYCKLVTKKQKYNRTDNYTFNDIRKKFYKETKKEEKLEKLEEKIKQKEIERQKCYVKIPYFNLLISFLISSVIITIGTLISAI